MCATLQPGIPPLDLEQHLNSDRKDMDVSLFKKPDATGAVSQGGAATAKPISIFYGLNSGTSEALARRFMDFGSQLSIPLMPPRTELFKTTWSSSPSRRMRVSHPIMPGTLLWLKDRSVKEMDNAAYAVFGAGNSEWRQTFHRAPKLVDDALERHKAERITPLVLTDVSERCIPRL